MNLFNINPENLVIRNNILSNNTVCTIYVSPEVFAGSVIIDYNFFDGFRNFTNETVGTNAVYGIPLFVDSLRNDYHLRAVSPCIDKGHPDQEYNDPADPNRPGFALYPAQGTLRNDMGAYGGPYETSWDIINSVDDKNLNFSTLPEIVELTQNYPNPFNSRTTIHYALPNRSRVTLTVFNLLGQEVIKLVNGYKEAGYHEVQLDGRNLESGVYFYRLQAGNFFQMKKFVLLK
jgi:hypothetical protein